MVSLGMLRSVNVGVWVGMTTRLFKPALAGLLAGFLVFAAVLSAAPALHAQFHDNSPSPSHPCMLCLFAKGHVDSPQTAPIVTAPTRPWFDARIQLISIPAVDFTYLAAPPRAPPALTSLLSVVG